MRSLIGNRLCYIAIPFFLLWGLAAGQAPQDGTALERLTSEVRQIRILLEQQPRQMRELQRVGLKTQRLAQLRQRIDTLGDELAAETSTLRDLQSGLAAAADDQRSGVEENMRAVTLRIEELRKSLAMSQTEADQLGVSLSSELR